MSEGKFIKGDFVYKNSVPTAIGVVYSCDGVLTQVSWGGSLPVPVNTTWLLKSDYSQTQVNIMQDISPELFRFIIEIQSALSDKSTLSVWEASVKMNSEKFIRMIENN